MAGIRSWSVASISEEEHAIYGASDPTDTPTMIMTYVEEPMEGSDNTEPDYTPTEHPSEPDYTPVEDNSSPDPSNPIYLLDYTPARLKLLTFDYETNEGGEDISTSLEISPPCPTPSHRSFRAHTTSTRVKQTMRKTIDIPSRKREKSPPPSQPPAKKLYGDPTWMPMIRSWRQ
ncbi:unnamed protein product [Lactuca saligna]|uniref:Uncharacterized protein n=1 Tax=Lactuca saligna TaxID=75948 RepID=A0AA35VBQ2_LACSI|nr:unnamed protein product [Lactuca saligna]